MAEEGFWERRWNRVAREWHVIWEAKGLFGTAALLLVAGTAFITWRAVASLDNEEIAVKAERIAFLNDQITAYKDRLQGATPDQAAKRIADLENQLKPLLDRMGGDIVRHVTDDQKAKIIESAKPYKALLSDFYFGVNSTADRDSYNYCEELYRSFEDAGLNPLWGCGFSIQEKGESGVVAQLFGDIAHPSDGAKAVMDILAKAVIQYTTEADPNHLPDTQVLGLEIFITKDRPTNPPAAPLPVQAPQGTPGRT
jgi:hypothetical protein